MDNPGKFNDIIRDKFAERRITFDEANWENIKKMTDSARGNRRRRRWIFVFLIGLLCGVIGSLPFIISTNSKNLITENVSKNKQKPENETWRTTETKNANNEKENNLSSLPQNTNRACRACCAASRPDIAPPGSQCPCW